jgi:2-keto-4-pentenoate hydratase/2-oxohepta-3-ene-1,7-dioic acid hydratase in catechol pathway
LKLLRFGPEGGERPGLLDDAGVLRDCSGEVADWTGATIGRASLERIAALGVRHFPAVTGYPRLGIPVAGIRKIVAVGLNYTDFAQAAGRPIPTEPVLFTKAVSALTGPHEQIMLPRGSTHTDWEVELGVLIGKTARYVEEAQALDHVAGYALVNDISEREYQNDRGGTWDKGKGCDTFAPVGPWLVTADQVEDPQRIDLWLEVNGHRHQDGRTERMIFGVAALVAYISRFITLEAGDLVATGTPPGVGFMHKPEPQFLRAGDVMRLGSSWLGVQEHLVIDWHAAPRRSSPPHDD